MGDLVSLLLGIEVLMLWMVFGFFLNHYGEAVTSRHNDLCVIIYKKSWFLCSLEIQKAFKMMIMLSQKPVHLQGYANFTCTHETFKRVHSSSIFYIKKLILIIILFFFQ